MKNSFQLKRGSFCIFIDFKISILEKHVLPYVGAIHKLSLHCITTALLLEFFKKLNCYKERDIYKMDINKTKFVVCINNEGYRASLELHKLYQVIPDKIVEDDGDIRIIDES